MSRWFRFYDAALDDPKVQKLSGELFKAWVNILCTASRNNGFLPDRGSLAFALRKSDKATDEIVAELTACGLIDITPQGPTPHNWSGRQYVGDTSYERVKRHRAKREAAGLISQWQAPPEVRAAIFERDGYACVYCESTENLTIDHKVPELRGGSNETDNLHTACRQCNASKRDLTHDEFVSRNVEKPLLKRPQRTEQNTEQNRPEEREDAPAKAVARTPAKRPTRLPTNWRPDHAGRSFAADCGLDPDSTADAFADYWSAAGGRTSTKLDWNAAFRTWCRRDRAGPVGQAAARAVQPARGGGAFFDQLALISSRTDADDDDRG